MAPKICILIVTCICTQVSLAQWEWGVETDVMTGEMLFAYSNSPWVSTLEDFSTGRCGDIDAWLNIQCDGKKQGAFVNFSRPVYPDSLFGDAEFTSVELFSTRVRFDDDLPFFALMGYDPSEPTYVIFFD